MSEIDVKPPKSTREKLIVAGMILIMTIPLLLLMKPWQKEVNPTATPGKTIADPIQGSVDAPVKIIEYGDFGCPTCRAWYQKGVIKQIQAKYGKDVAFIWRDFPVITFESPKAAEAGQCANEQGKFWEYHDYLYEKAQGITVDNLKDYAILVGLDSAKFNRCLDEGFYYTKVNLNLKDGYKKAFPGTPSFLVNDQKVFGPVNYDSLAGMVDKILAGLKSG